MAGLVLDPWQEFVLDKSLGEQASGKWAAFEVGLVAPRQNGKNSFLEARELAGLFLLGERLIIHSAHQFDTSVEQFRRLLELIEDTPEFDRRIHKISRAHGAEGITLRKDRRTGVQQRITFRTRTRGGGRGFSCDCLILDEAMILPEATVGALLPTLSARPNPQVLYTGSAVDQEIHEDGVVLARVRERGLKEDPSLAYFDFSVDADNPLEVSKATATDPEAWAQANPGLGIRITTEHIAREQRSMDPRTFAVERLGVGDWPRTDGLAGVAIMPEAWAALVDVGSKALDPVVFAFDVTPDRSSGSIGASGWRSDGGFHVEVVEHRRHTGWMVDRIVELVEKHRPVGVICDATGPAASLLPDLNKAMKAQDGRRDLLWGLHEKELTLVSAREHAQACGVIYDAVDQRTLHHLGSPELNSAVAGAVKRVLGDAWAWSRKDSSIDISPLVAVTLALWGSQTFVKPGKSTVIDLNEVMAEMQEAGEPLTPLI
jgi:hypothetical protein